MDLFKFLKPSAYAPAERISEHDCLLQSNFLHQKDKRLAIFDLFPDFILILNSTRQIVFANDAFASFLNFDTRTSMIGMRPGEALRCAHSNNDSGGCGTTEYCKVCGALHGVLETLGKDINSVNECEIDTVTGTALNLRIWTFPFHFENSTYVLCVMRDIAHEKYRHSLERIFFHDLTNIGSGIYSLLSMIGNDTESYLKYSNMLICLAREILEEISAQRDLLDAESGSIVVNIDTVPNLYIMNTINILFTGNPAAEGKTIVIPTGQENISFRGDPRLLTRVLGNMVKNALEASKKGDSVTVYSHKEDNEIVFSVHNPGVMTDEVKLQVFKRAFSTKGKGRGLGSYSVKLLTEKYMNGKVWFTSNAETGTTFYVSFPLS